MNSYLEPAVIQLTENARIDVVPPSEVERRSKSPLLLKIGELERERYPVDILDIMGQDDCGIMPIGPEPSE
jgi:hypothetical protein